MAKLITKTYSDALFSLAIEENSLDNTYNEAISVIGVFKDNTDLLKLLEHPKIIHEEKIELLENIFKNKISENLLGFLTLIVKKDRQSFIIGILEYFEAQVKEYKKIGVVKVSSAKPLNDDKKKKIAQKLLDTTNYLTLEVEYTVDESLIGGVVIRIKDRIVDGSVKTQIEKLSKELYKVQMK